jgi:CHAT domain-containing protein
VADSSEAVLFGAWEIRAQLEDLVGEHAAEVRRRLDELFAEAGRDPRVGTRILALLREYPRAYEWMRDYLERAGGRPPVTYRGIDPGYLEKSAPVATEDTRWGNPRGEALGSARPEESRGSPGLLGDDEADEGEAAPGLPHGADRPEERLFIAKIQDHPRGQPLDLGEQYEVAFSVGLSSDDRDAYTPWPGDVLAAAHPEIDVFDLTVQLDSDDFEILGAPERPLRVPRTGRSRGKARFDISPRHDGDCHLVASVHFRGNFVHQMQLTFRVGGDLPAPVKVASRGRPPESAANLEPRDISILLEPAPGGGFSCTALGSVGGRAILPITATELAVAVNAARNAMMEVIKRVSGGQKVFQTRIGIPDDAREFALRTLARAGARLFQHLFLHPAAGPGARRVGEWLTQNALDRDVRLTVQIFADHAPLPWSMLYLGDASEGAELDWDKFLGMRHIIEQLPLQMSLGTVDNEIASTPRLSVSVNVNMSIDQAMRISLVAGHQQRWRDTAAARTGLRLRPRSTRQEVVRALADGHTDDQVVYFYCHATSGQEEGDPDLAAIIMGRNDAATVADLNIDAPTTVQLPGNPLVFINACESAEMSPLFYNGFVPYFMAKGARGVIGTECKTPVLFAIEWANAFFDRFLDGEAVGEIVLDLRRRFVHEHGNPLGLIYAVHCDADTRIAPALARAAALAGQQAT